MLIYIVYIVWEFSKVVLVDLGVLLTEIKHNVKLECVSKFCYLGDTLGAIGGVEEAARVRVRCVCAQTSYLHIRQIRKIRQSLDLNSAILLANSLVSSRLDFCNSLFYGLPKSSIKRLQHVQNSLARVVIPSCKKYDHIQPVLQELHWLPVGKRIDFKLATLMFKVLENKQPMYLSELLHRHVPVRSLRSEGKNLLVVPNIKSANGRRSFSFAAPMIWNSLPEHIRNSCSLTIFRKQLKTHLFPP